MTVVWESTDCCDEQEMATTVDEHGPFTVVIMYCGHCYTVHSAEVGNLSMEADS